MDSKIIKMKQQKPLKFMLLMLVVMLNVGCDQVSKIVVRQKIDYHQYITVIKDHVTLTKVENTGAFLSAGDSLPDFVRIILLNVLPIFVLAYGFYYLFTQPNLPPAFQLGMCFLIGGGIGNIYDRIKFGSVTDFLHIDFILFETGVFNLADVSIMLGIGVLCYQTIIKKVQV
jgi:signal peptidase II